MKPSAKAHPLQTQKPRPEQNRVDHLPPGPGIIRQVSAVRRSVRRAPGSGTGQTPWREQAQSDDFRTQLLPYFDLPSTAAAVVTSTSVLFQSFSSLIDCATKAKAHNGHIDTLELDLCLYCTKARMAAEDA